MKIQDEYKDGALIFYHSSKGGLEAYKYLIDNQWRTSSGHYGHALYGNVEPLWKDNFAHTGSPTTQNSLYGNNGVRFRIRALRTHSLLFCNVKDGANVIHGYSASYAEQTMEDHGVPKGMIDSIMKLINGQTYASNTALKPRNNSDPGTLLNYGFNGFVYDGNLDGKTVVFYNPTPYNIRFTGVSLDDGKTFMDIPKGTSWGQFQKLVDDFKNPKKKTIKQVTRPSSVGSGAKSLVSASVLNYMQKPSTTKSYDRMVDLSAKYDAGDKLTYDEMVFVESWYIRFNLTSRRSVYSYLDGKRYSDTIVPAAFIVAYSCTDANCPVDITTIGLHINHQRVLGSLLPFSIKNPRSFGAWQSAFVLLQYPDDFRPVVVSAQSTLSDMQLGRFLAAYFYFDAKFRYNILKFWDSFSSSVESSYNTKMDKVIDSLNTKLPDEFSVLASGEKFLLKDTIASISASGVVLNTP